MQTPRAFVIFGSVLSCAILAFKAQAGPLTYNVSANGADNPLGAFSFLNPGQWSSGDLALPAGTTLGTTPLEIDVNLSENLTLNNTTTPGGLEFYGFGLAGLSPAIQPGGDAGQVMMELFEGATPVSPMFGFDFTSPFSSPISAYGTGSGAILPANAVFDEVKVFVSDSLSNPQETVTDVEISLQTSAVPDAGNTLPLLFLGCGATLGLGYRRGTVFCGKV